MSIQEMQQALALSHHPPEIQSVMCHAVDPKRAVTSGWEAARLLTEYCLTWEKRFGAQILTE